MLRTEHECSPGKGKVYISSDGEVSRAFLARALNYHLDQIEREAEDARREEARLAMEKAARDKFEKYIFNGTRLRYEESDPHASEMDRQRNGQVATVIYVPRLGVAAGGFYTLLWNADKLPTTYPDNGVEATGRWSTLTEARQFLSGLMDYYTILED